MIALLALQLVVAAGNPVVQTTHFSFHSGFWMGLHHVLYMQSRVRRGLDQGRDVVGFVQRDTVGWGQLADNERSAWNDALAYYDRALAERNAVFDSVLIWGKAELINVDDRGTLQGAQLDPEWIAALQKAEPVYRKLWWPRHDRANREFIQRAQSILQQHGDTVAARSARAFHTQWPTRRIRVDVTAFANWSGAYTTNGPSHITTTHHMPDHEILEMMHHEALHTLDRQLSRALDARARQTGKRDAGEFIHPLIFYTAGEITRQVIAGHRPYAEEHGLWTRGVFAEHRDAVYANWQPYLDRKISFEEAINRLVATLPG